MTAALFLSSSILPDTDIIVHPFPNCYPSAARGRLFLKCKVFYVFLLKNLQQFIIFRLEENSYPQNNWRNAIKQILAYAYLEQYELQ